jgi:hypothetical protein
VNADWNAEAVQSARDYLNEGPMSAVNVAGTATLKPKRATQRRASLSSCSRFMMTAPVSSVMTPVSNTRN